MRVPPKWPSRLLFKNPPVELRRKVKTENFTRYIKRRLEIRVED
jgi:hypothetical protein